MHILYLHQHFALPSGSTGTRSYEMARRWVAAGHQVTLICGRSDLSGLPDQRVFEVEGIQVRIVGAKYSQKQLFMQRIWAFLYFVAACTFEGLRVRNIDIIYATSTPLTIGIPAMLLKWGKRVPFVFEVRDQWPEVPIEMGYIKNPLLKQLLLWLEKVIYNSAAAIVALSPGMADGVRNVLQKDKNIIVVPNSSDTELFRPDVDGSTVRKENGWDDKLVFLHFGAMGKANGLDFVIEAAERVKENQNIHFVIVGDGSEKDRLIDKVKASGLKNVEFSGSKSKSELPALVAACDVSMVIFANHPILEHNSANKFFDSISAGRPVLLNYSGWQRKIIEENNAGFGCGLCDLDEFVQKVLYLYKNHDGLSNMGKNARQLAINLFNRDDLARKALQVIETIYSQTLKKKD
jgi:glycosyltransferase involved in cell wall biosynthesis